MSGLAIVALIVGDAYLQHVGFNEGHGLPVSQYAVAVLWIALTGAFGR